MIMTLTFFVLHLNDPAGGGGSGRTVPNQSASCFPAGGQTDRAADGRLPHSVCQGRMYFTKLLINTTDEHYLNLG